MENKEVSININTMTKEALFEVLVTGNIAKLNGQQKLDYTQALTTSLGLNPLSRPFQFISFQGKEMLYATKDCSEQLRKIHRVSVEDCNIQITDKVIIATAKVRDGLGRVDTATGVVPVPNSATDMAVAIMKAETKAKRRATLSICGLGILDESELDLMENQPINASQTPNQASAIANAPKININEPEVLPPEPETFEYEIYPSRIAVEKKEKVMDYITELQLKESAQSAYQIIEAEDYLTIISKKDLKKLTASGFRKVA